MFSGANSLRRCQWYKRASSLRTRRCWRSCRIREDVAHPRSRRRISQMPSRTCCTVIAGVHFFSPPGFADQEPGGEQRERLMVMPASPIADLVVGQARFALGALDTFLDAMFGLGDAGELGPFHVRRGNRQIEIDFDHATVFAITITNHDQHFLMAFLASGIA